MNWIALVFALELGWQGQEVGVIDGARWANYATQGEYVQLDGGVRLFDVLMVGGSAKVFAEPEALATWVPYDSRYTFWARVRLAWFEAGWEHECWHPVLSMRPRSTGYLFGGGDRLYVRVSVGLP